jgi:Phosphatidylinositol 3- and 4-kinase
MDDSQTPPDSPETNRGKTQAIPEKTGHAISLERALRLLAEGNIELHGLLPWSSNYTFLITVSDEELKATAVYKPCQGERPLWDFPEGTLSMREVAAYVVSEALGWSLVPPTVLREGPHGPGMVQLYVDVDHEQHYFTFGDKHAKEAQRIAVFDVLINNADRKAGHVMEDAQGHIWAIDHGVCFSPDPKLRTVIWDFAGQPIPPEILDDLRALCSQMSKHSPFIRALGKLLDAEEIEAMRRRLDRLIAKKRFPTPGPDRHYPWPPI